MSQRKFAPISQSTSITIKLLPPPLLHPQPNVSAAVPSCSELTKVVLYESLDIVSVVV